MEYIKVSECARRLGVTTPTIYRYCENGTIQHIKLKVGQKTTWKILKKEFEKLLLDGKL